MGEHNRYDGKVWGYAPVWGTGAALVELTPSNKALDFEKEFDEANAPVANTESGTGLESHNVLSEAPKRDEQQPEPERAVSSAIRTDRAPKPVGPYPHARRVGDFLFLSGIGPRKPVTGEIPGLTFDEKGNIAGHDIEVQTRACIENIRAILEDAGSSLDRIVDVTVYLTDMKRDFERFNEVYAEYLGTVQPTRTTVGVDSLPTPIAVELKVIAAV
ncbi:MAG: hypothetical protein JJE51_01595 [Thermoanaerobaculia bacterium]|nr:hypothetical protein [Thermoanaerobaculia bacterium]